MIFLKNTFFIVKFILLGGVLGLLALFFIPNSPFSFNWSEAQNMWQFYQQSQLTENSSENISENSSENQSQVFSYAKAIEKAGPSVVSIKAFRQGRARPANDGEEGAVLVDISVGAGSGVIFHNDGYIVTNYHVIVGSARVAVHFSDGRRKYAQIVGVDPQNDIAVLKVNIPTPLVADLGHSSELKTGDIVMAIGTPFGLFENSVTQGIVSAINHGPLFPRIQTDASINYGNSGGALINTDGQVIGINSAKFSLKKDDEIGINFAAPIDVVKEVFDSILKHGRVIRNWIGIDGGVLNPAGHKALNPGVKFGIGIFINGTEQGSPAEEAGLQYKDLLTHYDGKLITSIGYFRRLFMLTPLGHEVEIQVIRDGKPINMTLKLREKPNKKPNEKNG